MAGLTAFESGDGIKNEKVPVRVVSAAALKQSQISALENTLSAKLGKWAEIVPEIDPSVIGGLLIIVEGRIIDRTARKQLSDLIDRIKRRTAG